MAWQIDPYHLQVEFSAKHLGMMTVRGHFTEVTATGHHPARPPERRSSVEVTIPSASVRTNNPARDNDIRSGQLPGCGALPDDHLQEHQHSAHSDRIATT